MMNGIDVIMAELDDMSDEDQEEALEAIVSWANQQGFYVEYHA